MMNRSQPEGAQEPLAGGHDLDDHLDSAVDDLFAYYDTFQQVAHEHPTFGKWEGPGDKPEEITKKEWNEINDRVLEILGHRSEGQGDQLSVLPQEFQRRVATGSWEDDSPFPLDDIGRELVDAMIEGELNSDATTHIMHCIKHFRSWFEYYMAAGRSGERRRYGRVDVLNHMTRADQLRPTVSALFQRNGAGLQNRKPVISVQCIINGSRQGSPTNNAVGV